MATSIEDRLTALEKDVARLMMAQSNGTNKAEERRFESLALLWKSETKFLSNVTAKTMHPAYQKIIGMGELAIPLILKDLQAHGPNDWFWALTAITDENPITADIAGNMTAMTEAWLRWGQKEGYLKG